MRVPWMEKKTNEELLSQVNSGREIVNVVRRR